MTSKRRQLTEEEKNWANRLQRIWLSKKKQLGLSQESAAQLLGFNQSAFSQYVNGRIPLNTDAKLAFASLLTVPVTEIDPDFHKMAIRAGAVDEQLTDGIERQEGVMREVRRLRLKQQVDRFDKAADFARAYGLDPTYISQLLNGHRNIGEKSARKLENTIGIELFSLDRPIPDPSEQNTERQEGEDRRHGERRHGDRRTPESNAKERDITLVEAESADLDPSEFVYLDKLDVRVRGGSGETCGIEVVDKQIPFMRRTLRAAGVPPEAAKLVEFTGASMEPYAFHGDTGGVNTLDKWPIKDGKVYAFRDCDMMRVKILERRPGGGLRIRSYNNEEYPPEDLTAEEVKERIEIVGRVWWRSSVDY